MWAEKVTIDGHKYYATEAGEVSWDKPDALRTPAEMEAESGEWVWIPHQDRLWQPARIISDNGSAVVCQTRDGRNVTVERGMNKSDLTGGRKQDVQFWPVKLSNLRLLEEDLVMAEDVNEGIIVHTLRERYEKDELYTWVGAARSVLISVNPYKMLPLYGSDQISLHRNKPPNKPLPPHVFGIANDSFDSMLFEGRNQSVLISGESGAGKTEATKQCLKFLAEVAGSESNVEDRILLANPLLEAFGNAKTIRNNNSSRFGKWIEVYFNSVDRKICGAQILNYLLEKSRLVHQQADERNYHIFYQMTQDSSMCKKFSLKNPEAYNYLVQAGCVKVKGIDDKQDFKEVSHALDSLNFSSKERTWLFQVTAAVLNLGNVAFKAKAEKNNVQGSKITSGDALGFAAKFLDVDQKKLSKVLTYRTISVRGEKSTIPLDPNAARGGCDSLAKGIYGRLFSWLVGRVNDSLRGESGKFIGILDIFGFEIFDNNSFEQLCINFANEKLQQHFNRTTFKEEEALYLSEGIKFKHIEFIDNQVVLDLIEKRPVGVLLMLDEECLVPEGKDEKLMNKLEQQHARNPKFQTDKHRRLENSLAFEIEHYAGVVKYDASEFMVKNKDTLFPDMHALCAASKSKMTAALFAEEGRRALKSLSHQFRGQLNRLMEVLNATDSRYIRCVKPNGSQLSDKFNSPMVVDQLRYSGVFEAVQIRKTGYPFRFTFRKFACRFQCINPHHRYRARDDRALCEEILEVSNQDFGDVQLGKSLVLYRAKEHRVLQLLRNLALEVIVPVCQKVIRGHLARQMRRRLLKAETELANALNIASDIKVLKKAIKAVPKIIGTYSRLFDYEPRNLQEAVRHKEKLQQWVELEATFDRLTQIAQPGEEDLAEMRRAVEAASGMLDIPRTDRQLMLYDLARDTIIYMEIKVSEQFLDRSGGQFRSLAGFGKLRSSQDFASKKMFGKKKAAESMLVWSKSLPNSLVAVDDPEVRKAAVKAHKALLRYMQDKKNAKPSHETATEILQVLQVSPAMRTELYLQLMKQLTQNPTQESVQLGFQLLSIYLSVFLPDEELGNYLIMFLRDNAPGGHKKWVSRYHATKYGGESNIPLAHEIPAVLAEFDSFTTPSRFSVMPKRS